MKDLTVVVAPGAGFCRGVETAVQMARAAADRPGRVATLGPIVHNEEVVRDLKAIGVDVVESVDELSEGDTVVIRSHGVPPEVLAAARERNLEVVDATCPRVAHVQRTAADMAHAGHRVIVIGDPDHPEVKGIVGYAGQGAVVVRTATEARSVELEPPIAVVCQTTIRPEVMDQAVATLRERLRVDRVESTVCAATTTRQREARTIADTVDLMLVVGNAHSSNTRELVEACAETGTATRLIRSASDLDRAWFRSGMKVGITAGASTPRRTIKEVMTRMEEIKDKSEDIKDEEVKDEEVTDEEVKDEEVKDEEVTDEEVKDEEVKDEEVKDEEVEDEEVKDEEVTDEEVKDEEVKDEEVKDEEVKDEEVKDEGVKPEDDTVEAEAGEQEAEAAAQPETEVAGDEESAEVTAAEPPAEQGEPDQELQAEDVEVKSLRPGDIVRGTVVAIGQDNVLVDVGHKSEGVIPLWELSQRHVETPTDVVNVGDAINVYVLAVEGEEGVLRLSKKRASEETSWQQLEDSFSNADIIEAPVTEEVKGGLIVDIGVRGFMPASHVERGYVSDLGQYVGRDVRVRVIELDRQKNRVILSQKAVLEEEYQKLREETWSTITEGDRRTGVVKSITDFGAFVDIGGVDGLLHVSEMSWGRVNHPSEVVSEGDEIEVAILRIDREKEKISLGLKQVLPDPWDDVERTYPADSVVTGKVVRIVGFGAFVQLEPGVEGLVHISQLANRRVVTPDEVVSVGDEIKAKVLRVSSKERRISLSMKEVEQAREHAVMKEYMQDEQRDNVTLGDVFGDILNESKDRIAGENGDDEDD